MRKELKCGADTVNKAALSLGLEKLSTKSPEWTDADKKTQRIS